MKVLITGGTGRVGTVTERFVAHGWEVRVIGIDPDFEYAGAEYALCDIMDFDQLRKQVRGCEAVVHLAAIPGPTLVPGHDLFQINVAGTFNVFEAAAAEGIKRIVQASSINALGCFWGNTDIWPQYLPIDEVHPTFTTDPYSFSKEAVEDIGRYYWRREGISSLSIRLPGVWGRARVSSDEVKKNQARMAPLLDEFAAQPEGKRRTRLAKIREQSLAHRSQKLMEFPAAKNGIARNGFSDDPLWPAYNFTRFNFWAYVDERDSAQAMEKGITAAFKGSHPLFINAAYNDLGYDTVTLARLFFPEVERWQRPVSGIESLVSIDKARALIGFEPEYSI